MREHVGALCFDAFWHLAVAIAAEDDAAHHEIANAAGVRNWIGVLEAADMDALAPCCARHDGSLCCSVGRFRGLESGLQRDDVAEFRVTWAADARDRVERGGFDLAVADEAVTDMNHDDLADDQLAAGLAEFEALPE